MKEATFLNRSSPDYHEFSLSFCGRHIKNFKTSRFRKNSKFPARIYAKVFHPPGCPEKLWCYYLVFEVNGTTHDVTPIAVEAFDTLTQGIEAVSYPNIDFYIIEEYQPDKK